MILNFIFSYSFFAQIGKRITLQNWPLNTIYNVSYVVVGKIISFEHDTVISCTTGIFGKLINKINFQNEIAFGVCRETKILMGLKILWINRIEKAIYELKNHIFELSYVRYPTGRYN